MFNMDVVTPDYFKTFGLPVLRGRAFNGDDQKGAEQVVVISEGTARRYWPRQDPIGKRLFMGSANDKAFTVVGVVPDIRYRDLREALPSVYYPLAQSSFGFVPTTLAIRAAGAPAALVPVVRRVIDQTAPGVRLARAAPFETYLRGPLAQPRLNTFLLGAFAIAAAMLAAVGLFGVMATTVRQRAHEIGVRMALGATSREIQTMLLSRGLAIAGAGVLAGVVAALTTNHALSALLYGVSATDIKTLLGVVSFLAVMALLATLGPARLGSRVEPITALRSDG
jgi:Zn-dependent protease